MADSLQEQVAEALRPHERNPWGQHDGWWECCCGEVHSHEHVAASLIASLGLKEEWWVMVGSTKLVGPYLHRRDAKIQLVQRVPGCYVASFIVSAPRDALQVEESGQ